MPDDLAIAEPSGGRSGLGCRPTLPLVFFFAPYPPDPLPRWGRGSPKDYFAGGFAPGTPALNRLRHRLNLPRRYPADGLPSLSPPCPAFSLLCCPLSPRPPSPVGKGEPQRLFRRGLRPRHPGVKPPAALTVPAMRAPRARSLRCGAKPAETLSYEQCRQPRKGGTGGDGTIRRTRRRRLRWSSPPGQG